MSPLLLTESGDFTFPTDPAARVIWIILLAAIVGLYIVVNRTRRRAREQYLSIKQREAEMRASDPDMKKEEG